MPTCKVDALIERHSLSVPDSRYGSVDEYLVTRWTGSDGRPADGYKTLTAWFNKRVLKRLYRDHGRDTVRLHVDREYEVLTGDDAIQRDELAADFAMHGLDIETVDDDMVSWSTMRRHLKGCLDARKETVSASTDWELNSVRKAERTAVEKARSALTSLSTKGRVADADRVEVDAQIKLGCPECSVRVPFEEAVERGYVCETHLDAGGTAPDADDDGRLSGLAGLWLVAESLQRLPVGETLLVEATRWVAV